MTNVLSEFTFPRTGLTVRNRTVLAALTNKQSHDDGVLSQEEHHWLTLRGKGGFGIVTTAAANVTEHGRGWEGELGVWSDHQVPGLAHLASKLSEYGAVSLAQLFHGGMRSPFNLTGVQPVSASENTEPSMMGIVTKELTHDEIESIIVAFGSAAARCEAAGFSGVELHGAHSYLISQFLGPNTNRRNDQWGGDLMGRSMFLQRIIEQVRAQTSQEFIVGVRLSPTIQDLGIELQETLQVAKWCAGWGLDFIHVSCWDVFQTQADKYGQEISLTKWFSNHLEGQIPIITTGKIWDGEDVRFAMDEGADLVGVGRAGIAHYDWPQQLSKGDSSPKKPPFTVEQLKQAGLSDTFVTYMSRWDGFVIPRN
ncbi:NADH:flavin oxidoreductase [Candidatus Poseidonia alphae]|nr:NADH:flavin oxidoreductase [Candidatus Poseidonia alphae]